MSETAEQIRLAQAREHVKDWKLWGCYVSERAWGTVREDYSADGAAWDYFPFEQAHLRAFRWNEDGIAGICDRKQNICFAVSFWNEKDKILKERLYGVGGTQGNHGEDVKEYYFYLDNTPTHSYMKFLYKYPQNEFPYDLLKNENIRRDKSCPEFELYDTKIFDDDKYFDIFIEYAKADFDDICLKITAFNRSSEKSELHILPTLWFRNQWSWTKDQKKPLMQMADISAGGISAVDVSDPVAGNMRLFCQNAPEILFTENESDFKKLFNAENISEFTKNGINDFVVENKKEAVNPQKRGTKAAPHYIFEIEPGQSQNVYLRLAAQNSPNIQPAFNNSEEFAGECEKVFQSRIKEADEFYGVVTPENLSPDEKNVMRQALAGMLWSKQFYHYVVKDWLEGDEAFPPPPSSRRKGRNHNWTNVYNDEVLSMPDKWEYPWFAAWDLAFHCIPLAMIDADFAKRQLLLLLREWYMHPNGQIPAYEWAFGDVNPPVHAWAALRVYKIEAKNTGISDRIFLERVFHKLLLNFTWWVNRKDTEGNNIFEGGFLGLDNIGVFDRSAKLPTGGIMEQSDGTSWMAMFCLNMLAIALELAKKDKAYEDVASKFFEHFVFISDAMNNVGDDNTQLWNEADGFYYDVLHLEHHRNIPVKIRSMVGLIPLFAVETIEYRWLDDLPDFKRRTEWFLENRPDLTSDIACMHEPGRENRYLLAIADKQRLRKILSYMFSEAEFLSEFGIRSLSLFHKDSPYFLMLDNTEYRVGYEPGESESGMFGGNSNWRGPVWFPLNYLLIESLQKFDYYYGEDFKIEFPTGSGIELTLWEISQELERRLCRIFLRDENGKRAVFGSNTKFQKDENFCDYIPFYEYFHADNGAGLGASHQTGWTGLMGKILQQLGEYSSTKSGIDAYTTIRFRYAPDSDKK